MNAVKTDGDNMGAPESPRSASAIARRNSSPIKRNGHIKGIRFTLGRLLARTNHRSAQMKTCHNFNNIKFKSPSIYCNPFNSFFTPHLLKFHPFFLCNGILKEGSYQFEEVL